MAECRNCRRDIPDDAYLCPYCGMRRSYYPGVYEVTPETRATSGTVVEYLSTYTLALSTAIRYPESRFIDAVVNDFQKVWPTIPSELQMRIREGDEAVHRFNLEIEKRERSTRIVVLMGTTNLMFQDKKQAKLFREDNPLVITELYTPCKDEHHFTVKIASLASLFEVKLEPLQRLVREPCDMRSIALVETWLRENSISYDQSMIETWRNIVILRNMEPIHAHASEADLLAALKFFGSFLPIKYGACWDKILHRFLASLEEWQRVLQLL